MPNGQYCNWQRRTEFLQHAVYADHDHKTFAIDALTDLLHFCRANGVDFESAYHMAEIHYHEESKEASHE